MLAFMLLIISSGLVVVARYALPGDLLYGVKITAEEMELALTLNPIQKTDLHVSFAGRRLVELQELVLEGQFEYIPATVAGFEAHISQAAQGIQAVNKRDRHRGSDLASRLKEVLEVQAPLLGVFANAVPQQYRADMQLAVNLAAATSQEMNALISSAN